MSSRTILCAVLAAVALALGGCGSSDAVDSTKAAQQAYLALDKAVGKALQLGFDGYNAASSANIPPQMTDGDVAGTLQVTGQVDMGSSSNKQMRLMLTLTGYTDTPASADVMVVYDTNDPLPALDLSLRSVPNGTLSGTLTGTFHMQGDLQHDVTLNLTISGMLEPDPSDSTKVARVPGSTHVTGTATSSYGTYDVDVTI